MVLAVLPTKPPRMPHDLIYLEQRYSRSGTDCNAGPRLKIDHIVYDSNPLSVQSIQSLAVQRKPDEGTLLARQLQAYLLDKRVPVFNSEDPAFFAPRDMLPADSAWRVTDCR
jgi:hypothetical protein